MRILPFIVSFIITIALIIVLNSKWGTIPLIGKFLSPQVGFWQNAELVNKIDHVGIQWIMMILEGNWVQFSVAVIGINT